MSTSCCSLSNTAIPGAAVYSPDDSTALRGRGAAVYSPDDSTALRGRGAAVYSPDDSTTLRGGRGACTYSFVSLRDGCARRTNEGRDATTLD